MRSLESNSNNLYIYALFLWKWEIIHELIKQSVIHSKSGQFSVAVIKVSHTKHYELILNGHHDNGRWCDASQTHQTFTKQNVGYIAMGAVENHHDDLFLSVLRILNSVYCMCVCRSQRPIADVRGFHRPNFRAAWTSAGTEEQARALCHWAAYSTPNDTLLCRVTRGAAG